MVQIEVVWSQERIIEKIRETFPEDPDRAVAIAKAESHLIATSTNPEAHKDRNGNVLCYGSIGVMQMACIHNIEKPKALEDVDLNLQKARKVYEERGWSAWGAYTDKRYLEYL